MALIRPELRAALWRWREVLGGLALAGFGAWIVLLGGYFFQGLGGAVVALGLALALVAWRRVRFHGQGNSPGVVEVTEGQITYLAPSGGGFAALSEISVIDLAFTISGQRVWRISQTGNPPLTIPVSATGAEALFDSFVALPGGDPARILAAMRRRPVEGTVTVWRRAGRLALT